MPGNPISWFEIYVGDMDRAVAFYETVLGTKLEVLRAPSDGDPVHMRAFPSEQTAYGAGGALVHVPGYAPSGSATMIYFMCDDVAGPEGRVVAAGGKVERSKMSIGEYGFVAHVIDTEGNMIGLHSMQ